MLYQKQLDIADILQKNMLIKKAEFEIEQPDVHISEQRQSTLTHIDPLAERKIFECIKQGKKEELIKNLRRLPESGELGVLSKTSHLRSQRILPLRLLHLQLDLLLKAEFSLKSHILLVIYLYKNSKKYIKMKQYPLF